MISPHPTYSPRGTPISVLNRCRALCALGHTIDLVTYGIGEDVPVCGLTYVRAPVPGISSVGVGPSAAKFPLDLAVFVKALALLVRYRGRYDVLHTHEEAGIVGVFAARALRIPHVYDMGNDLAVVMRNYGFGAHHPATILAGAIERSMIRSAAVVIAHFAAVAGHALAVGRPGTRVVAVPNVPVEPGPQPDLVASLRSAWSADGWAVALYTGTLEPYQGLESAIDALPVLRDGRVKVRLVVVGGTAVQRRALSERADRLGVADRLVVLAPVPQRDITSYLTAADVLVSPRRSGSNTPLKVFSYLASGRPIVATRIASHTQVLDDTCAVLVAPDAQGLAGGIEDVLDAPGHAAELAASARSRATAHYSVRQYISSVSDAYTGVGARPVTPVGTTAASAVLVAQLV